jgi:hypothetical protein
MIRRTYALILLVVGVLVLIAAVLKLLPGGAGLGAGLCFLGLLMTGLSFVPLREQTTDAPQMSGVERVTGMFYQPARVFESLRARPHWLAPVLIIAVLSFAYTQAFMRRVTPERIISFTMDKVAESGFIPADKVEAQKEAQIAAAKSPVGIVAAGTNAFVGLFTFVAIFAALYVLAVMMFGGRIGYWQSLAMTAYAWMPAIIIGRLLSLVILYVKDPETLHPILGQETLVTDNLGALVSPAQHPILFSVATAFGVLAFYRLWLTATGLNHASEKFSKSSAWTVALIFWALGLLFAVALSALFGNFIS